MSMNDKEKGEYIEYLREKIASGLGIPAEMMEPSLSLLSETVVEISEPRKGESE
jgi:hypothetical protein